MKAPLMRFLAATTTALNEFEVDVIVSSDAVARDNDVWDTAGLKLASYRRNPVVLFNHDPATPVGTASNIRVAGDKLLARVTFAPAGVSTKADEIRGLVKAGVLLGVSAGIQAISAEPLDPAKPRGAVRVTSAELLEFSFVAVPANTDAVVTARAHPMTRKPAGPAAPRRATDPGLPARLAALDALNRTAQQSRRAAVEAGGAAGVVAFREQAAADALARSAAYPRPESRAERLADVARLSK